MGLHELWLPAKVHRLIGRIDLDYHPWHGGVGRVLQPWHVRWGQRVVRLLQRVLRRAGRHPDRDCVNSIASFSSLVFFKDNIMLQQKKKKKKKSSWLFPLLKKKKKKKKKK